MSTLKNLSPKSISEMTMEELHEFLRQTRHLRRTPKASTKKRQTKKAEQRAKEAKIPDASGFSKDLLASLLAELGGEDESDGSDEDGSNLGN